jgi:hypothetical protein
MGRDDGQQGDPAEDDRDEDVETDVEARVFHGIPTLRVTTTDLPGPVGLSPQQKPNGSAHHNKGARVFNTAPV